MINTSIPLVDLHRHLDGNVRVNTIWELGHQHGIALPADSLETLAPFVQIQGKETSLVAFLKKLDWMVAVLADLDAVKRVAYENVADAALSGLDYAELRFSPYYMAMNHKLPIEGVVEAVIDGVKAGLKDYQVKINLIGIMSRSFGQAACTQELEGLLAHKQHLVAMDLAGDELGFPGELFNEHFKRVRDAGLAITAHAGEAAGSQSMWQAIQELGATRIGHGVNAIHDPKLMEYLAKHRIGIESCPTSNLHTSTVSSYAEHPFRTFMDAGVLISLNTDDPGVSAIDIKHEYRIAKSELGLSDAELAQVQRNGVEMAFLSESERKALYAAKA
ncbi:MULTISPECIES: adenosine deaminase [Shewanella]|uniref:Adenosine deaminase n=3 Tax=Shewanella TaxID=22 RepID=ADD_SHESA|nr:MULTISPECIES: adenosine deaminase [Shewanella]A0L2R5.1 RecName: Full=Adenosine deaminase; AltName: Full=Adenosine aminohydrolase [Shewanella sp. ANA-3]QXN24994.1 adenosine deaminase [Shewanella putrefaciens]ABK50334.1 adenosine deaminase [Shewanella sp. ANA-3]ASK71117.1 adenosine deaminase family protein [Shewanella bicestrii]MBW0279503.1 adenosine deaminase family protein [Shewanella xiamenensis]MCT8861445.1 adenosine deaminase [Shewanella xiamenensis]